MKPATQGYLIRQGDDILTCVVNQPTLDEAVAVNGSLHDYEKMAIRMFPVDHMTITSLPPHDLNEMVGTLLFDDISPREHVDGMSYEKMYILIGTKERDDGL